MESEKVIILNFYERYKNIIRGFHPNVTEEHLNFLTYLQIVEDSHFNVSKYRKIFDNLPEYAQVEILNFLNIDKDNFVKRFKDAIAVYRQELKREQEKYNG